MTAIKNETTSTATINREQLMIEQAEACRQLLDHCMTAPGADITIQIKHTDGQQAVAELYDHAALVQSLWLALKEFIEEI